MKTMTAKTRFVRITINDIPVSHSAYSITEAVDNLCTVAEFTLASQPIVEPFAGDVDTEADDVLIEWVDMDADLSYPMFGGKINSIDIESEPWQMVIRCVDQLELLRKIRNGGDLIFGEPDGSPDMTEGEALMELLDYCGVNYDPDDIADSGYVLGSQVKVSWLADGTTSAASVAAELNRVFRMSLFTIGNNRVIRLPYNPSPSTSTGAYDTYVKNRDIDFQAHHRTHGERDQVQNVWVVRGVEKEIHGGSCTLTPWARSEYGSLLIGSSRRARISTQEFQSDLIQDEGLAEAIVRSQMQLTNRMPDGGSATLFNDPNVHQCSKIGIKDKTYGIQANIRYFLVRSVTRNDMVMTLELQAGPAGDEGTVTHGVDKVCNDSHSDSDMPGDFGFPEDAFPPIDLGEAFDMGFTPVLDVVEPPNTTDPFINCAMVPDMGTIDPDDLDDDGLGLLEDVSDNAWRPILVEDVGVHADEEGNVDEYRFWAGNRTFYFNLDPGLVGSKSDTEDIEVGEALLLAVTGEAIFRTSNSSQGITFFLEGGSFTLDATITFYPDPGFFFDASIELSTTDHVFPIVSHTEHMTPDYSDIASAGVCISPSIWCNNGGYMGKDEIVPLMAWTPFVATFNLSEPLQSIFGMFGGVSGTNADMACWGVSCENDFGWAVTTGQHTLQMLIAGMPGGGDNTDPDIRIRNLEVGWSTCEINPDYEPPEAE